MSRLPVLKPHEVIAMLRKAGYIVDHQTGSHVVLYKQGSLPITVPRHNRDLKKGTVHQIIQCTGLSVDEFVTLR